MKQQLDVDGDTSASQFEDGKLQLIVNLKMILVVFWILLFTTESKGIEDTLQYENILENVNLQSPNEVINLKKKLKTTASGKYTELTTHEIKLNLDFQLNL